MGSIKRAATLTLIFFGISSYAVHDDKNDKARHRDENPISQEYLCKGIGGVKEWSININLAKKQAHFFDNDSNTLFKLTQTKLLESSPPQWTYEFENNGRKIVFNKTKKTVTLTQPDGEPLSAEKGCTSYNYPTKDQDKDSSIKNKQPIKLMSFDTLKD